MSTPVLDPATGTPLPPDSIQRILFVSPKVHVYNIPPLSSTKGHVASTWTADPSRQIFTARLRILETAVAVPITSRDGSVTTDEKVKTDILLEDGQTGDLFAAAPYTSPHVVEQVLDSSRFFALTVQAPGPRGRKAVLGIGFEERSEAFDFSVALQEVRKTLGIEPGFEKGKNGSGSGSGRGKEGKEKEEVKRDFSLKEGETITVNLAGRGKAKGRRSEGSGVSSGSGSDIGAGAGFALPPPPGSSADVGPFLPPPPSAQEIKAQKRLSQTIPMTPEPGSIEELGFDDGEFGEFQ